MRSGWGVRVFLLTGVMVIGAALAGCDDSGMSGSTPSAGSDTVADQAAQNSSGGQGSTEAVTLSWEAPTENADGTALTDLQGYKVHYGLQPGSYSDTVDLANPGLTMFVVQNLSAGLYYFAVTSYNSSGEESALSPEISTQVD